MRDEREMREATPSDTTGSLSGCSCCSGCSCLAAPRGAANPALAVLAALAALASLTVLDALSVDALCKRLTKTLPAQTARRGRAAAERGHTRSYGLAVSIVGGLLPLSPCSSSWFSRSCSRCSCCSCCSRLACNACTLSRLPRFPFHDSQVHFGSLF